jgi:hypothetical protein
LIINLKKEVTLLKKFEALFLKFEREILISRIILFIIGYYICHKVMDGAYNNLFYLLILLLIGFLMVIPTFINLARRKYVCGDFFMLALGSFFIIVASTNFLL